MVKSISICVKILTSEIYMLEFHEYILIGVSELQIWLIVLNVFFEEHYTGNDKARCCWIIRRYIGSLWIKFELFFVNGLEF